MSTDTNNTISSRFLLLRPESLATDLQDELKGAFGTLGAHRIRQHVGRVLGTEDARVHAEQKEQLFRLLPDYFKTIGWGSIEITEEDLEEDNLRLVFKVADSFEANAVLSRGLRHTEEACVMCAGYVGGWLQASFEEAVRVEEVSCRAKGDQDCVFVAASPARELQDNQSRPRN